MSIGALLSDDQIKNVVERDGADYVCEHGGEDLVKDVFDGNVVVFAVHDDFLLQDLHVSENNFLRGEDLVRFGDRVSEGGQELDKSHEKPEGLGF